MPPPVVDLIPIDRHCAALVARNAAGFDEKYDVDSSDVRDHMASVIGMTPEAMLDAGEWGTYFAYEVETGRIVGTCGFKARPSPDGMVEIAYYTFPPFEGRGFATEMANILVARAVSSIDVGEIIAHTLPEPNASTRILERCAFQRAGEHIDPEDGPIWRWRYGA